MLNDRRRFELSDLQIDFHATPEELSAWNEMIQQIPDVRVEKVQAIRTALQLNQYDEQLYLDRAVDAISRDLSPS